MTKYIYKITALIFSGLFLFSCESQQKQELFQGETIAKPIIYEVIIKNPDPENEWKDECLANTDSDKLVKDILNAVLKEKLQAFDYYDNHELSLSEIELIIEENKLSDRTGTIQFEEDWYWDKNKLKLRKEVRKIMFGYEIYDNLGKLRGYKASFVIDMCTK